MSLTLGSFRDSAAAGGDVTPRLGVELTSRALPLSLILPYCRTASTDERREMRIQEGRTYEAGTNNSSGGGSVL